MTKLFVNLNVIYTLIFGYQQDAALSGWSSDKFLLEHFEGDYDPR